MKYKTSSVSERIDTYNVIDKIQIGTKVHITDYEDWNESYILTRGNGKYLFKSENNRYCDGVENLNDLLDILKEDYDNGMILNIEIEDLEYKN